MGILLFAAMGLPFVAGADQPTVEKASFLTPEDLGVLKYVFRASPGERQVVVFREKQYFNGSLQVTYDTVSKPEGKSFEVPVVIMNLSVFSTSGESKSRVKAAGSEGVVDGNLRASTVGDAEAQFSFESKDGFKRKYEFTIFVEDYDAAKKRIPDLPDFSGLWWTFATTVPVPSPTPAGP